MTIAAAYLTSEGVVLGADSTTTVKIPDQAGNLAAAQWLNHAQKVYEVGGPNTGRFAIASWGAGSLGQVSHRTMAARAAEAFPDQATVPEAVDAFCGLVQPEVDGALRDGDVVGYFLGGVDSRTFLPDCWRLLFRPNQQVMREQLGIGDARFEGAPHVFTRVFWGFDPDLPQKLLGELREALPDDVQDLDQLFETAFNDVARRFAIVGQNDLPIREAIDFIHTYLHITIKSFKFRFGPPLCGGPAEIGFITTDRRFRWALHKPFDTAISEHVGGTNV